ncbi:hypothetical protein MPTK1_5g08920 [Marchantia polymorpha subsp. ruderalis]|uniref:Uncharacterized protein n=2 Tax=Marchantia polymorpha TaxID=3197 RepID=A0AAF6BGF3_MARPO|nr:hypothetical protein MARPO_0095s0066 [Marchantia polymorpha]BBN11087.1 hypothetical protein Mp_5g08920 [Marchantia polymorpha subsp. ruderalis]|eukprot:PTQ32810.1 hypothetical protein MARPO_0095s0066 [Marchantia polymorpha]
MVYDGRGVPALGRQQQMRETKLWSCNFSKEGMVSHQGSGRRPKSDVGLKVISFHASLVSSCLKARYHIKVRAEDQKAMWD